MLPGTTPRPSGRRAASTDSERQRIARYQAARELAASQPTVRGKKKPAILNLAVIPVLYTLIEGARERRQSRRKPPRTPGTLGERPLPETD